MKIRGIGTLVLALSLGLAGSSWAVADSFPVDFAVNYTGASVDTMVKAEGNELRVSVHDLSGESVEDYLMDSTQGTIAKSSGVLVTHGGEGWNEAYNAVVASLTAVRDGLAESTDTSSVASLDSTITYLQNFV